MAYYSSNIFCLYFIHLLFLCTESPIALGKYVYLDSSECIHADKYCFSKLDGKEFNSREVQLIRISGVAFVDTADLYKYKDCTICPRCVTDKIYDEIRIHQTDVLYCEDSIAVENKMDDSMISLKKLYDTLKEDGAKLPSSYKEFNDYMTAPGLKGVRHRQKVYDALKADGVDLPDTYEKFSRTLFMPKQ